MITQVLKVHENKVVIKFDDRADFVIETDNGYAWHLAEHLLSPKINMTYSEYMHVVETCEEVTEEVAA